MRKTFLLICAVVALSALVWAGQYQKREITATLTVTTDTGAVDTATTYDTLDVGSWPHKTGQFINSSTVPAVMRYDATIAALVDTPTGDGGDTGYIAIVQYLNGGYTAVVEDSGALPLTIGGYLYDDTLFACEGFNLIWRVTVYDTIDDTVTVAPDFSISGALLTQ